MKLFTVPAILAVAITLGHSPLCGLDLTPRYITPNATDGQRIYFEDGENDPVTFRLTPATTITGSGGEATLQFNDLQGATLLLRDSPLQPDVAFSEETLETYRAIARQFAPAGHLKILKETVKLDVMAHHQWNASILTTTYELPGSEVTQAVTFVNYTPKQQIVMVLSAFSEEFEQAQKQMNRLMNTWSTLSKERLEQPDDS